MLNYCGNQFSNPPTFGPTMTHEELKKVIEVAERRYPYDPDFTETETNLARLGFVAGAVWMARKRERETNSK